MLGSQLDGFVAGCRIRHRIHKHDLINAHAHETPYEGLHLFDRCLGKRVQNIVNLDVSLKTAVGNPFNKGFVSGLEIVIFSQSVLKKRLLSGV